MVAKSNWLGSSRAIYFSATISENITLGRDFNLKEIEHICQLVNLDEFIKSLPQGYDTEITSAMI